jgi:hypothetical protein
MYLHKPRSRSIPFPAFVWHQRIITYTDTMTTNAFDGSITLSVRRDDTIDHTLSDWPRTLRP